APVARRRGARGYRGWPVVHNDRARGRAAASEKAPRRRSTAQLKFGLLPLLKLRYLPDPHGHNPHAARHSQTRMAQGAGARRAELPGAEAPDAGPRAPYGVRGGSLPEYRRVLG